MFWGTLKTASASIIMLLLYYSYVILLYYNYYIIIMKVNCFRNSASTRKMILPRKLACSTSFYIAVFVQF